MKTPDYPEETENGTDDKNAKADTAEQADWRWAEPKSLKVNPNFQRLIPLQAKGELLALEESIKAEGCRDPLLVWKGQTVVLDGHTRRELCIRHKKQVKVQEIELPNEQAAVEYIKQIQRQRRNLTREALSYFRGAEYNALKQQRGGVRSNQKAKSQGDTLPPTAERLAEKYGVSVITIKRDAVFAKAIATIVADHGDPEIKRKLLGADVKLTHGLARLLLKKPAAERKAAVEQLLEQGEKPRAKKGGTRTPRPKEVAQTFVKRLNKKGEGHARAVLQQMAKLLGMTVVEKSSEK